MTLKSFFDRRRTLLTVGGIGGVLSFILAIVSLASNSWVKFEVETPDGDPFVDVTYGLWKYHSVEHNPYGTTEPATRDAKWSKADKTSALEATQAFVILGFLTTLVTVAAGIFGAIKRNAEHPWPKITFIATAIHALLIFCALISFAIFRKHFKDTYGGHKGAAELHADEQDKYAGGWATLLINFFLTAGLSIALVLKFGLAGAIGTGALPEGTTSFSDAAAMGGGYQVDQA